MAVEGEGGYGYLYSGGTNGIVTSYKYGGDSTGSLAINANGDVGGYYINSSGTRAARPRSCTRAGPPTP